VKDLPTLQRWIVEKRVLPSDRISEDGTNWDVVSLRPDLRPFFAVIEQIKAAKRQLRQREREVREVAQRAVQALASSTSGDLLSSLDSMSVQELASGALEEEFSATPIPGAKSSGMIHAATSAMAAMANSASAVESAPIDSPRDSISSTDPPEPEASGSFSDAGQASDAAISAPSWSGSGPVSDSVPVGETRNLPVVDDAAVSPAEAGALGADQSFAEGAEGDSESAFWSQSGWGEGSADSEPSVDSVGGGADSGPSDEAAESAFDPDQTFDEFKAGSGAGFYVGVLLFFVLAAGGLWYVLLGPGSLDTTPEAAQSTSAAAPTAASQAGAVLQLDPAKADPEGAETGETEGPDSAGSADANAAGTSPSAKSSDASSSNAVPGGAKSASTPPSQLSEPKKAQPKKTPAKKVEPKKTEPKKTQPVKQIDHFAAGERFFDRGSFTSAIDSYKKALRADPKHFKAAKQLGWAYIEAGQASSARAAFGKAVSLRRSSSEAHYGLGLAHEELGSDSRAIQEYEEALKLAPKGPDAPELRALISKMK